MDLTLFIHQFKDIDIINFSLFLKKFKEQENINSKYNLFLLFFLILKNNESFYSLVTDLNFQFDMNYKSSINMLKSLNLPVEIVNLFFSNIQYFQKQALFKNDKIKQVLFDISTLFSHHDFERFFYNKVNSVKFILHGKEPVSSYENLLSLFSYKQKKEIFEECIFNFRVSSIFILNDLFLKQPRLFSKKYLLSYMNIFSQCNFREKIFYYIESENKKSLFKLGCNLSFTTFSFIELKTFFDDLYVKNELMFYLVSSGFISNPRNNFPEVIEYLKKKIHFHSLEKKICSSHKKTVKQLKI